MVVIAESWRSYYGITAQERDEQLVSDIVLAVDTFGSLMGLDKGYGEGIAPISIELLAKVVGEIVLARGIARDDRNGLAALKGLCCSIVESPPVSEIEGLDKTQLVDDGVLRVRSIMTSEFYQFVEPPIIVAELARVCIYESVGNCLRDIGKQPPLKIQRALDDQMEKHRALLRSYQRLRVIEDRVWHLFNAPTYCGCIKRAFLSLRVRQLVTLALCYYTNERVPDIDVLEALGDAGEQATRRGTQVRQTNIDRNVHYLLRSVLPDRLAHEFASAIDSLISDDHSGRRAMAFHPMLEPYMRHNDNSSHADFEALLEFCRSRIGMQSLLLADELTQMCGILEGAHHCRS